MKRNTFMSIAAVIGLVFGVSFVLFPGQMMSLYETEVGEAGIWLGRYFGSAIIGVTVVNWLARNADTSVALRAILLGFCVMSIVGLIVAVLEMISGISGALIWLNIVIYLFLAVGYGYFGFVKTADS